MSNELDFIDEPQENSLAAFSHVPDLSKMEPSNIELSDELLDARGRGGKESTIPLYRGPQCTGHQQP